LSTQPGLNIVDARVEVAGAVGIGESEQVRDRVVVLQRTGPPQQTDIGFGRVRAHETLRICARVVVGVDTGIEFQCFAEWHAPADVAVEFDAAADRQGSAGVIGKPADVAAPDAGVEAAVVGVLDAALQGGFLIGLGQAAEQVVAGQGERAAGAGVCAAGGEEKCGRKNGVHAKRGW
jgi:hypothetical protein